MEIFRHGGNNDGVLRQKYSPQNITDYLKTMSPAELYRIMPAANKTNFSCVKEPKIQTFYYNQLYWRYVHQHIAMKQYSLNSIQLVKVK